MSNTDPKLRIENAFVEFVRPVYPNVFRASDREADVVPPYVMCWAENVEPRGENIFKVSMRILLVTHIDDGTNSERSNAAGRLFDRFLNPTQFAYDGVAVLGWSRPMPRELSSEQKTGDSLDFTAGVIVGDPVS
jgi:hypothetical protein